MSEIEIRHQEAWLKLQKIGGGICSLKVHALETLAEDEMAELLAKFNISTQEQAIEIISTDRVQSAQRNAFLDRSILTKYKSKFLVSKDLQQHQDTPFGELDYLSADSVSRTEFDHIFSQASHGDKDVEGSPEKVVDMMIAYAGQRFDMEKWKIVSHRATILGLLLPQLYPDFPERGSLFYIGLLPAHRRKGHGLKVHAAGLTFLKTMGAKEYYGSTTVENKGMIEIFNRNGCKPMATQYFYRYEK